MLEKLRDECEAWKNLAEHRYKDLLKQNEIYECRTGDLLKNGDAQEKKIEDLEGLNQLYFKMLTRLLKVIADLENELNE